MLTFAEMNAFLLDERNPTERRTMFLAFLDRALKERSRHPSWCLVGGGAVEFYTRGNYATKDLDVIAVDRETLFSLLLEWRFQRQPSIRNWYQPDWDILVEYLGEGPVLLGGHVLPWKEVLSVPVGEDEAREEIYYIQILPIEIMILDRLLAAAHWFPEKPTACEDFRWAGVLLAVAERAPKNAFMEHRGDFDVLLSQLRSVAREEGVERLLLELVDRVLGRKEGIRECDGREISR